MVKFIAKKESDYINVDKLSTMGCFVPFNHIEIHSWGDVSICCHTWLPEMCGNLINDSLESIINNIKKKEIREDMLNGKFDHCNDLCPQLNAFLSNVSDKDQYWDIRPLDELKKAIETQKKYEIYFSYDQSCNLQCPSCRKELIVHKLNDETQPARRLRIIHEKVKQLIKHLIEKNDGKIYLNITGSGDPFASPTYWEYLKELAKQGLPDTVSIRLQTNGIMMTEQYWDQIKPIWKNIEFMNISVDAATEETYKIVRKGGNFTKLVNNLEVFDNMVQQNLFPRLTGWQTNFIVQRDNFRELKQFVEWQVTFKTIRYIWTNLIAQWYHLEDDEYNEMAIWRDGSPYQQELIDILKDPIFKHPKLKAGNMNILMPKE